MRQPKGQRKARSINARAAMVKYLLGIFQTAFVQAAGAPQQRFELACQKTDQVILTLCNTRPHEKGFFLLVIQDFKASLEAIMQNQILIEAVTATEAVTA